MSPMQLIITGAIVAAALFVSVFFLRFWRQTRDPFFLYFALAFLLQGLGRAAPAFGQDQAHDALLYVSRLVAYLMIVIAIWTKNRKGKRGRARPASGKK